MRVAGPLAPTLESRNRELHGGGKTVVQNPLQDPGKKKKRLRGLPGFSLDHPPASIDREV